MSIAWKAGLVIGLFQLISGITVLGMYSSVLAAFVFLDPGLYQSVWQSAGNLYVKTAYRLKKVSLPSKDNYICKADYILPFTGKWTVFNGGVDKELSHSWGIVSQRYAYDFIILDDNSKSFDTNKGFDANKDVQSYYCYGKDIIAPADGVVVKISNKHKDSRVNGAKAYCDTWDIRGNFIVIQHARQEFSTIAHLLSGSISVSVGNKVKQGDVIAKCGNSGNSSEPHIHFQLQSGKSFCASAGLPIAFSNINAQEKANYSWADTRVCEGNLQQAGDKTYIGRGLEVENTI